MQKSLILGGTAGAAGGALTGLAWNEKDQGKAAAISAAVGAGIGVLSGYFVHKGLEKRDSDVRKNTLFNLENHGIVQSTGNLTPTEFNFLLSNPRVQEDFVETHIEGSKLIQGHKVWTIIENSRWDLSGKPIPKRTPKGKNKIK